MTHLEFAPTTANRTALLPREDGRHVLEGRRPGDGGDAVTLRSEASDASRHVHGLANQESGAVLLRYERSHFYPCSIRVFFFFFSPFPVFHSFQFLRRARVA